MRILIVHPGASFSVADVYNGWLKALQKLGCTVGEFNLDQRLLFYGQAEIKGIRALSPADATRLAARGVHSSCYEFDPDVVFVISAFYIAPTTWDLWKHKRVKRVVLFTESPYQDDRQIRVVEHAEPDLVFVNDPINIERYPGSVLYAPHSYDPDIHYPGTDLRPVDFSFVGTGYPSRIRFFEQVDWKGLDVTFAGHWKNLRRRSKLRKFIPHDLRTCYDNTDTANLYRQSKVAANLYRGADPVEADADHLRNGWAIGPREVELAACETFFLRESRGEGDGLFPMLPTFTEPDEFGDMLRWWLAHPDEREKTARLAHEAIADRTFDANARRMLDKLGR